MRTYLLRRVLLFIPTLIIVSVGIFLMLRVAPGDIAVLTVLGSGEPLIQDRLEAARQVEEFRVLHGLDRPIYSQYLSWMGGLITGDLGRSYRGNEPIIDELKRRWPITIELMVIAVTFSTIIALTVGVLAAVYQDTWLDYLVRGTTLLGQAIPFFWVGTLIIIFLVTVFDWLPPLDMHYLWENPVENLKQMIIPGLVLAYFGSATSSRLVRSAMLEVLRQDYIRTARAKGLPEKAVIIRHALRNALIPVVTVKGAQMVALMGGSVIAESIFVVPGMGSLLIEAINGRDYIVTQTLVVIFATMVVSVNLIVDVTYAWLNPRIVYR